MRFGLVCASLTAVVAIAHAGSSKPDSAPVVVVPFTGLHGDEPQAAVVKALGARAAVVPESGLGGLKPYLILRGSIDKQNGLRLTIRLTDEKGNPAGSLVVPITIGRHLTQDQLRNLGADIDDLVQQALAAQSAPAEPVTPPPPPPDAPQKQLGDVESAPLTATPDTFRVKPASEPVRVRRIWLPSVPRPSYYPYAIARAGAVVTSRALDFAPGQPPTFHGGTAGGVHAEVELYPFAWSHALKRGVFAGLGGWFGVDKPFWPTTTLDGTANEYDTDELRLEGGARWRFVVRKLAPVVEITAYGGAGLHSFTIAKAIASTGNPVDAGPPDARYVYGVVGAEARAHFLNARLAPFVRIGYEYVPDAGPTENLDEFGLSSTHGFQLRGGLDARVWRNLTVGASAFWEYLALSFEQSVPTAKRANDAHDQYYGGIFTVGWAL